MGANGEAEHLDVRRENHSNHPCTELVSLSSGNTSPGESPSSSSAPVSVAGRNVDDEVPQNQVEGGEDGPNGGASTTEDDFDLEEFIVGRNYRLFLPYDSDLRPGFLNRVAFVRYNRFEQSSNINDLEEAIALDREALSFSPVGHSSRSASLSELANAIQARYNRFGHFNDIGDAISLHQEALSLCPVGHSNRSSSLNNLAIAIQARFKRFSDANDIDEAIALHREALSLRPVGHDNRSSSLNNLANVIQERYMRLGDVDDINEAITLHREALSLFPAGHSNRSSSLDNLANTIEARYERFGDVKDIDEAITLHREALSLRPVAHNYRSSSLNNLANSIHTRYERFGDISDIDEAITLHQEALSLRPVGHHDRSGSLNNLAIATRARYERFGDVNDIDEAIALHREALRLRPVGRDDHSSSLTSLANAIHARYERFNNVNVNDIDEAITLHHEALSLSPVGHSSRWGLLSNFANVIQVRYHRFGDPNDIEKAITLHQEALSLRPVGHNHRSGTLNNLATAIQARYERLGDINDINEVITLNREALVLLPVGHNSRSSLLSDLANAFWLRHGRLKEVSDLEKANLLVREALDLQPPGHHNRYASVALLSKLLTLGVVQGGSNDNLLLRTVLDEAQSLVKEVVTDPSAPVALRLDLAVHHGSVWAYAADSRVSMHLQCIKLLQTLVVVNPNITSQQLSLRERAGIASALTALALDASNTETAVIVSDGGRSLLLGTIQQYRSPLEGLSHVNRELADKLQSVGSQLERLALLGESQASIPKFATELDFMLTTQRHLREQWNSLLDQIHALPGLEKFLTTPPFTELQTAASDGPLILLNAHKSRCDAIIIFSSGSPEVVPLRDPVSLDTLNELYEGLTTARSGNPAGERRALVRIFRFLWEHVVSRVVDCLMSRGLESGSRVWWCPTSIFSLLPIHAAGMYNGQPDCNLSDFYISSYTPTVSELIRARRSRSRSLEPLALPNRLLFIGNSGKGAGPLRELQNVERELVAIRKTVGYVASIAAADASPSIVLEKLQQHPWAHFACHGAVDTDDPTKSHFVLEDQKQLPVKDILSVKLDDAEFAFLSACHSAAPGLALPDEGIHLSSAMMFAGFRSVVGTMWEIYDTEAPIISELFYRNLMRLGGRHMDAAEALHRTIRARCKSDAKQGVFRPERWAMLIHIGA